MDGRWTARAYDERMEKERFEHAFLVRTWCESGDASAPAVWRGSVEHLPTKQRRYFREFADLCAFILMHQLTDTTKK